MDTRRSKLEIYLEVLSILKSGVNKPTLVMYKANISWQPLMRVLSSMIDQGLVTENKLNMKHTDKIDAEGHRKDKVDRRTWRTFHITQKGHDTIRYFSTFQREYPDIAESVGFNFNF